jgi:hypothetical protein
MQDWVVWGFNVRALGHSRDSDCWLGGTNFRRRLVLSDDFAALYGHVRAIHSKTSALSQPMFLPRNRCL